MAECGICLDTLQNPVSIPCGHIHCEQCLRRHISSEADALKSACPTCRKAFHIATPDFTFVPRKYHDFIMPSVRKIYIDIPSVATMAAEVDALTQRLEAFAKENEHLRQRCADYKYALENTTSEKHDVKEQAERARQEAANVRKKYDSLKKRFWEAQSRDDACNMYNITASQSLSRRSSQDSDASREILPKAEEQPVSLQELDLNPRPKRALPKSRLSNSTRHKDESVSVSEFVKRQRTHRYSDVGSTNQLRKVAFKCEYEEGG